MCCEKVSVGIGETGPVDHCLYSHNLRNAYHLTICWQDRLVAGVMMPAKIASDSICWTPEKALINKIDGTRLDVINVRRDELCANEAHQHDPQPP
jgi:hypothetical protein